MKRLSKCLKLFIFILLFFALTTSILCLFIPNFKLLGNYSFYERATYDILDEKKDSIDVVFLGDSVVYSGISPMQIWNEYGYTSFDSTFVAIVPRQAYDYLKIILSSQHPKVIVLESDCLFRNEKNRKQADIVKFKNQDMKNKYPIEKYHNNWKRLISFDKLDRNLVNINKGYKFITKIKSGINSKPSKSHPIIPLENIKYLEKIIKLCDDNNTKLMFMSTPALKTWSKYKHETIINLAQHYNIDFVDMNYELKDVIDWNTDTKDRGIHLNYLGARKVSSYIGSYLKEKYYLIDHRNDINYDIWNKTYEKYQKTNLKLLQ